MNYVRYHVPVLVLKNLSLLFHLLTLWLELFILSSRFLLRFFMVPLLFRNFFLGFELLVFYLYFCHFLNAVPLDNWWRLLWHLPFNVLLLVLLLYNMNLIWICMLRRLDGWIIVQLREISIKNGAKILKLSKFIPLFMLLYLIINLWNLKMFLVFIPGISFKPEKVLFSPFLVSFSFPFVLL